jgi:hypothetical protein
LRLCPKPNHEPSVFGFPARSSGSLSPRALRIAGPGTGHNGVLRSTNLFVLLENLRSSQKEIQPAFPAQILRTPKSLSFPRLSFKSAFPSHRFRELNRRHGCDIPHAYLHFQLLNCGDNFPAVPSAPSLLVQDSFDIHPTVNTGLVTGTIIGNDQILCGNVASTWYQVTPMKGLEPPFKRRPALCHLRQLDTESELLSRIRGTWNPLLAMPMTTPPPAPGFLAVYENPTLGQFISQPGGTSLVFQGLGSFDFSQLLPAQLIMPQKVDLVNALVPVAELDSETPTSSTCLSGISTWVACSGGGGGGGNATELQGYPISATAPATGAGLFYVGGVWSPSTTANQPSVCSVVLPGDIISPFPTQ